MQPHQERVVAEHAELKDKTDKLAAFFKSPIFAGLDQDEKTRLELQFVCMTAYLAILQSRIEDF